MMPIAVGPLSSAARHSAVRPAARVSKACLTAATRWRSSASSARPPPIGAPMPASAQAMLITPYEGGSSPISLASNDLASLAAKSNADGSSAVQAIVRIDFMTCLSLFCATITQGPRQDAHDTIDLLYHSVYSIP